ncbi:tudor domain-containing protein 5 [Neosynchiropus ocellatus]
MKDKNLLSTLKKDVASLLVSSQFGLDPDQLKRDYASMLGHPLPLKELGFHNVIDMVKKMPDVVSVYFNDDGGIVLKAVGCDAAKNIEQLVSKQKKKKKKSAYYFAPHFSRPVPRRHNPPPVLPAHLRAQIHFLLSKGPILLSQLEGHYHHCFGYRLHVQNFGFFSIAEMLVSASDFVTVQQSRLGTVLHLKRLSSAHTFPKKTSAGLKPGVSSGQPDLVVKQCPTNLVTENTTSDSVKKESTNEPEVDVKSNVDLKRAPVFHEQVLKLEGDFRQQILQNGLAGCISQELKDKLKKVVGQSGDGIALHNIPEEYKRVFGEAFPLSHSGFLNITELISAMDDTLHLQPNQHNKHHWIVTNKEDTLLDQRQHSYYLNSEDSLWEQEQQDDNVTNVEDEKSITNLDCKIQDKDFLHPEMGLVIQVCSNPDVPPDAIQSQHINPPTKHGVRELVEVLVEYVESPGHFYIRFSEGEEGKALEEMMIEMRRCYKSPDVSERYSLPEPFVRQGQVCCVSPKGMWFYRVVLSEIVSHTEVKVYFADFGDTATVQTASLKFLKSCFGILPAQAVPSTLAGIKPKDGTWSTEATRSFQEMCSNRILVGALNCYIDDWLQIYLCDTHADDDLYIHSALIIQDHGVPSLCSASATVCLPFSPVSLHMGDGKLQLPSVEWEEIPPPKPVDPLKRRLFSGLKVDDEELPSLEFVVGSVIQDENPFQALITDQTKFDSHSTIISCPSSSPSSLPPPPDSIERTQASTKCEALADSPSPIRSSCDHKSLEKTLHSQSSVLAASPSTSEIACVLQGQHGILEGR